MLFRGDNETIPLNLKPDIIMFQKYYELAPGYSYGETEPSPIEADKEES